tara:strand:- start:4322 stop:5509 length:1188 start_codon:yes stop_codon:yes gene_type:complete
MKIAAFIDISHSAGGGLQQTLGVVKLLKKITAKNYTLQFVTSNIKISEYFNNRGVDNFLFNKNNFLTKLMLKISKINIFNKIFKKYNPFETFLKKNKFDLVFFIDQSSLALYCEKTSFIFNIWQLDHRKLNFFPEYDFRTYFQTENLYKFAANRSFKILIDCEKSKNEFAHFYNCSKKKINIQPLLPNLIFSKKELTPKLKDKRISNLNLKKTIFYPAQFWAHKNHSYLLDAILHMKNSGMGNYSFIFTGRDRGNLNFIREKIKKLDIEKNIHVIEYLNDEEIIYLYENCLSLVLPTFVGSTSLPLYEAFYFKSNVIYNNDILDNELKDKVLKLDIKDPKNLCEILKKFEENKDFNKEKLNLAKNYIDQILDEENLINNYKKIFDEFYYYYSRYN